MTTDTQRIRLEKEFRDFIKANGENSWKDYIGSELESLCVNFIKQSYYKKHDELEAQVKLYKPLADEYMEGKKDIETENKKLKESIESLLVMVDAKLSPLDKHEIEKDESHIWKRVIENAEKLIN